MLHGEQEIISYSEAKDTYLWGYISSYESLYSYGKGHTNYFREETSEMLSVTSSN